MEFPQDYFGSAADRSQLAARRLLRDVRKEARPQASVPYHPYAHEQWRSRLPINHHHHQQQQQQPPPTNEQQEKRFVTTTATGHVGSNAPASPAAPPSSYRRILLLGPPPSSNASDRLVSPPNRNNYYVSSSQYLPSRCENDVVGHEAPPPQYFRREVVRRDGDREKVTVNFLAAMANRMEMLSRAKASRDDSEEKYKHADLDVSLHL